VALTLVLGLATAWAASLPVLPVEIPANERARLRQVADAATVSARVDARAFPGRQDVFEYLLDHPEFATHVTRALRLARYRIWRADDGLWLDDGWGARGRFHVVHARQGMRVLHARGEYEQRFLPNISGEAVVVIEYASRPASEGRSEVTPAISGFVKLDNRVLAAAGRVASTVATAKAEKEAHRLAKVFMRVSRVRPKNRGLPGLSSSSRIQASVPKPAKSDASSPLRKRSP